MARTLNSATEAIIIKRTNVGETDRVVTILTRDQGKQAVIAKGVRNLSSSRRAYLEPGNYIKCLLVTTKSLPILTQATLLEDCHQVRDDLARIRHLTQVLEIVDTLFVEEQGGEELFEDILTLREYVLKKQISPQEVRRQFEELIIKLGYQDPKDTHYQSISEYVSALADKPLRAWEYLKVPS